MIVEVVKAAPLLFDWISSIFSYFGMSEYPFLYLTAVRKYEFDGFIFL